MKQRKKLPPYIKKLCLELEDLFDVGGWDHTVGFPEIDTQEKVAAEIITEEDYQRLHINFYPCFFESSRICQRQYLLHEFCHTITHGMLNLLDEFKAGKLVTPQQIKFESERATSKISNMVDALLYGGYNKKRKAYEAFLVKPKLKRKLRK